MNQIKQITSNPLQTNKLTLPDGTFLTMTIRYVPQQYGWFIQSLTYQTFTLNGYRIVTNPNMLQQWKNKLPFGLACFTNDNGEPKLQEDFSSGYATLYLLTAIEVQEWTDILSGKVRA